ncbi:MAG: type II toxin-antitoxin system RelE/ParE family toxin [Desulfomonilaceae bacterium]|nr:type II toxin-antitoxin system RelE/ParE family toxin [Desulfomonilaceae bacterium]
MSVKVFLRRDAQAEFDEAFDWYERRKPGLGVDFVAHVQAVFDEIKTRPEMYATVFQDIRRATVRRFPYSVFYTVEPQRVVVLAVFHTKRDPTTWRDRA